MADAAVLSPSNKRGRGRLKGETYKRGPGKRAAVTSELVSARQAEQEKGIPYTTLRKLHHDGQLAVVKFGEAWFFKRAELDALIQRNTEHAT